MRKINLKIRRIVFKEKLMLPYFFLFLPRFLVSTKRSKEFTILFSMCNELFLREIQKKSSRIIIKKYLF